MALVRPLVVWTVTDGRAGIENQALGLAEAIQRLTPAEITRKRPCFRPLFDRWPNALRLWPNAMLSPDSDRIESPWPDLLVACGRASLPFSARMRRWSAGRTFVVQLQDPKTDLQPFDLVIPPLHDGLAGSNVFPILGSPNRVTSDRLAEEARPFADRIEPLPGPRVAVLVGGRSKAHSMSAETASALADRLGEAVRESGGSVLVTFSRRTPVGVRSVLTTRLADLPGWIWDGEGPNPYFAFLHFADHIAVTEDSVNMAAEAAATGRPVHILALEGGSPKFEAFHAALQARGAARPFAGSLDSWTYDPLDETRRAAREVLERMQVLRHPGRP